MFNGYKRKDGRYGVRNEVLVISSVLCASGVVEAIGRVFPDIATIQHAYGCGYGPEDFFTSLNTFSGIVNNPNVGAVLVIGLGCELLKSEYIAQAVLDKPAESLEVQEAGSAETVKKGIDIVQKMISHVNAMKREPAPLSDLIVGLDCGGSDAFSGVTANPAVGEAADILVSQGATVIMGETTEMIGTAHIMKKRCKDEELGTRIEKLILEQEKFVRNYLGELAGLVISPGNIDGGLSSITEKSLGCIAKAGSTPIVELVDYAAKPSKKGLIIMNTTGYDIDDMAAMAAAGAQIILFTTGRGTPAGFPAVPVIKVSSNTTTYKKMSGDIDVNAGSILDDNKSIKEVGEEIFRLLVNVANGELTRAEINKSRPFSCLKQGPSF
jgi:altronate dehydratase large subunit